MRVYYVMENLENEIWLDVKGYENLYYVSNLGRIKTPDRTQLHNHVSKKLSYYKSQIIKPHIGTTGYFNVRLNKNGIGKTKKVHRLVAEAFIHNPENKPEVNHIDANKLNNNISNLEWCTRKENVNHAISLGLCKHGEQKFNNKLTYKNISIIKIMLAEKKLFHREIALIFKVHKSCISAISVGRTWKNS